MNPADKATKWGSGPCLNSTDEWFNGPGFLWLHEKEWPTRKANLVEPAEELRAVHLHCEKILQTPFDVTEFSRLERLIKFLAYIFHFVHNCRSSIRTPPELREPALTQRDFVAAEKCLWKITQNVAFHEEISILRKNKHLPIHKQKRLIKSSENISLPGR